MAQTQAESLRLLIEIGRLLSSRLDFGEILRSVLELASRLVDSQSASLLLLDEQTGELYFDVALGLGEEASRMRLKLGEGIAGCVARDRVSAIINEAVKDPRWSPQMDRLSGFTTRSILAAPLVIQDRLIGVIEAINKKGGDFSAEDLRVFEAFAAQASIAIDNARLFSSLKEEKFKLDTIFSEMTDAAVLTDDAGRILLANDAAKKLIGNGSRPDSLTELFKDMAVTPPLDRILKGAEAAHDFTAAREKPTRLILGGKAAGLSLERRRAGRDAGRRGWLWVFSDETEERQKEALKRTFLSLISHKLKTPLASVTGFSEILLEEFKEAPPPPLQLQAAQTIAAQGKKLSDLVDKLLRYTTLESHDSAVELSPVEIDPLVEEAVKSLLGWLADNKAAVTFKPSGGVVVFSDRDHLREVVKNLVENAVKFNAKAVRRVSIWIEADEARAALCVSDDGPGIPPEDQEKVFSMFHQVEASFTGQVEGMGLGLPYVKKIVEGQGGKVELSSKLGEGTTVRVTLPRRA